MQGRSGQNAARPVVVVLQAYEVFIKQYSGNLHASLVDHLVDHKDTQSFNVSWCGDAMWEKVPSTKRAPIPIFEGVHRQSFET